MRDIRKRPWVWRCKAAVTAIVLLAVAAAVLRASWVNYPIKEGNPEDFWRAVLREGRYSSLEMSREAPYRPGDERFLYLRSPDGMGCGGWDGCFGTVYCVRTEDCTAYRRLGRPMQLSVRREITALLERREDLDIPDARRADPNLLIRLLHDADNSALLELQKSDPAEFLQQKRYRERFDENLTHIRCYWAWQTAIELVFLSGLALFALWPWLRSLDGRWAALHLGLLPCLYCMPFWLGYSFGGTFDPILGTGGVLYPDLLRHLAWLRWTPLDTAAAPLYPNVLSLLSAPPADAAGLALQFKQRVSIVGAALLGMPVAAIAFAASGIWKACVTQVGDLLAKDSSGRSSLGEGGCDGRRREEPPPE